jgi:hypothetical protein
MFLSELIFDSEKLTSGDEAMEINTKCIVYFNLIKSDVILDLYLDYCFTYMYEESLSCLLRMTGSSTTVGNVDWLIIYGFTSRSRIFHFYGNLTIAGEGLQNLGLCSALRAFEQGMIFIVPHLPWHGTSVFPVSSEGPPHLVAFYDRQVDAEDLF